MEAQIRESFGRVVYSHKAHEKCADDILFWYSIRRWIQTALAAIASTGFITILFGGVNNYYSAVWGGAAAVTLAFLNAYMQGRNAEQEAQKHTSVASKLWLVRESYLSLINDLQSRTVSLEEAKDQRSALQEQLAAIYEDAPRTNSKFYRQAQVGLKKNEELTFSDEEIDAFLPAKLRKNPSL